MKWKKRTRAVLREKNKNSRTTLFYMETLVMTAVFIVMMLILIQVFARSKQMSLQARVLTYAVHLAENAAEAVSASDSAEKLYLLLDEGGNICWLEGRSVTMLRVQYNGEMKPVQSGRFWVDVTWVPENGSGESRLVKSTITVYWDGEEVYTLDTAVYTGGAS